LHSNLNSIVIMKTKINKYIVLSLLLVLGASCSDNFLEEKKQYGTFGDEFYQSEERVNWFINNMYYDYFDGYKTPIATVVGSYTTVQTSYTEEIGGVQPFTNPNLTYVNATDGSGYYGIALNDKIQNHPYNRIRDCNSVLESIDVYGTNLSKTFSDGIKGQIYYLRALQYFDLMRTYGGVPIVTSVQIASSSDPLTQIPRASVTEVVKQITSDLDLAANLLPGKWDASNYGRFTKGAAMAQKSRVLLTYASPLFNKNWDTDMTRWDAALKAGTDAETQLMADGHNLSGTTAKEWEAMFYNKDNVFNPEAITVKLLSNSTLGALYSNNSWERSMRIGSQAGVSGGGVKAPKSMIDLFPMENGTRPMDVHGNAINGYSPFLFFKGRDPRFYRTFAYSGSYWPYNNNLALPNNHVYSPTVWAYRWAVSSATNTAFGYSLGNNAASPALVKKMSSPTAGNLSNFQYSGTDIMEYRFAELLLNIAECYAAKGEITNAVTYLSKIRQRVGIASANNYGIGTLTTKYQALEAVLYERRIELAYEGKRFYDIQRWMLYSDDASLNDNTNAKLDIPVINGTQRIGNYLHYKNGFSAVGTDPLANSARAAISVDPDNTNFKAQIALLEAFYTANFELKSPPSPMDAFPSGSATAVDILWRPNYYIMGLNQTALLQNPWLQQTKDWKDANGSFGTFNYQE
jgi:hypothetical protein